MICPGLCNHTIGLVMCCSYSMPLLAPMNKAGRDFEGHLVCPLYFADLDHKLVVDQNMLDSYFPTGAQMSLPAFNKLQSIPWFSLVRSATVAPRSFAMAQHESPALIKYRTESSGQTSGIGVADSAAPRKRYRARRNTTTSKKNGSMYRQASLSLLRKACSLFAVSLGFIKNA